MAAYCVLWRTTDLWSLLYYEIEKSPTIEINIHILTSMYVTVSNIFN